MCVGGVEHSDAAAVELEDQAVFGVHADAVAGELFAVVGEGDPLAQLRAQATPGLDHLLLAAFGRADPVVQRGQNPLGHGHPLARRPAGQVQAGGGGLEVLREVVFRLVAVDADADDCRDL